MGKPNFLLLTLFYCFLIVLFAQSGLQHKEDAGKHDILLNDDNFDRYMEEKGKMFGIFYRAECEGCEELDLQLQKVSGMLLDLESSLSIAKINTEQSPLLEKRFQVLHFPTLRLLDNSRSVDTEYTGVWTSDALLDWLLRHTAPVRLSTAEQLNTLLDTVGTAAVAFLDNDEDGGEAGRVVKEWAGGQHDLPVAVTSSPDVLQHYGGSVGSIVLFRGGEPRRQTTIESASQLKQWVAAGRPSLLLTLSEDTYGQVFSREDKTIVLLFSGAESGEKLEDGSRSDVEMDDPRAAVAEVAREWSDKVTFVWADVGSGELQRVREWFGVPSGSAPVLRGLRSRRLRRFRPSRPGVSQEMVRTFLQELTQHKLKPFLPSEALPADWDSGTVKTLVGDNFDSVVLDRSRHVLVDLYAPWCGHCKRLEPVLEQLGEKYKDSNMVTIAKMDATKNELSHTKPRSFPSIRMWKKETNEVVEYNGERTLQGISRFIETDGDYGRGPTDDEEFGDVDMEYEEDLEEDDGRWSERHSEL